MSDLDLFESFPKIKRLNENCVVTEKIDGTNAQVMITPEGIVAAGSRSRWITPEADNYGFAKWAANNAEELKKLGVGRHYGEWWGSKIQRGYGLTEKRFSLFNTARPVETVPTCCSVVPVLYVGPLDLAQINRVMADLFASGSRAAPGFMKPEGVVITFHRERYKMTFDHPKGKWTALVDNVQQPVVL